MGFVHGWWGRHQRSIARVMDLGLLLWRDRLVLLLLLLLLMLQMMVLGFPFFLVPQLSCLNLATSFQYFLRQNFRIVLFNLSDVGNLGPLLRSGSVFARLSLRSR